MGGLHLLIPGLVLNPLESLNSLLGDDMFVDEVSHPSNDTQKSYSYLQDPVEPSLPETDGSSITDSVIPVLKGTLEEAKDLANYGFSMLNTSIGQKIAAGAILYFAFNMLTQAVTQRFLSPRINNNVHFQVSPMPGQTIEMTDTFNKQGERILFLRNIEQRV
jgi:hypothetical protein